MTGTHSWLGWILAVAFVAMLPPGGVAAATFVVTATADTPGSTCSETCSLRQAINAANALPGADTILFGIPGVGPHTITVGSALVITEAVLIDGYSQPGASPNTRTDASDDAVLKVRIASSGGLIFVCGDDSEIRGLSFGLADRIALTVGLPGICAGKGQRTRITGNFFGLAPDGSSLGPIVQGMEAYGVQVQVGGALPAERNVFANATTDGVLLQDLTGAAGGSVVLNNLFGTDPTGTLALPNARGISIVFESDVTLGSDAAPNLFRFNGQAIVLVGETQGNRLYANHVAGSTGLGIDLSDDGVTANDVDDADTGPNELQNFPVLDRALASPSGLSVSGSLDVPVSVDGESYRIAIYESAACNASGHGEGEVYVGTQLVTLSGSSSELEDFTFTLPGSGPAAGQVVTATATNPDGSTSEFSACVTVQDNTVFADGFEGKNQ